MIEIVEVEVSRQYVHTFSLFDLINCARTLEMVDRTAACNVVAMIAVGMFERFERREVREFPSVSNSRLIFPD